MNPGSETVASGAARAGAAAAGTAVGPAAPPAGPAPAPVEATVAAPTAAPPPGAVHSPPRRAAPARGSGRPALLAPGFLRPALLRHGTAVRLFLTVWLVYALHATTNVVRETYLAIALGERLSIRVDEFLGLHPDLFEIEGRGAFINNNPGASMLGAVPYALARPAIDLLLRLKPELESPKPPATYDDPRPNRTRFMNEARARGLDVKLGLAALSTGIGLMAPLGAAAAVLMFLFLRTRLGNARTALWLALLYAFGTPVFFRSAFLNQNAILAHLTLGAYAVLAWPAGDGAAARRAAGAGFLLGTGLLCDFSAAPLLVAFGGWLLVTSAIRGGAAGALRAAAAFGLGAAGPIAVLLAYQWAAFGNPLLPAQAYMPPTEYSVRGWNGFFWPAPELLWRNLLDPRYGLFAFAPMLAAALAAPFLRRRPGGPDAAGLALILTASGALYLFVSSVQFAYLQHNTGVRYMVPAAPLLFLALLPVLLRLPRPALWLLVLPTIVVSWSTAMAREDVITSIGRIFLRGFELPVLTVLEKMASGYMPALAGGTSPLPLFLLAGAVIWLLWRGHATTEPPPLTGAPADDR